MGRRWWAVFKKRNRGKVQNSQGDRGGVIDAVMQPPVLSIQAAPVKEGFAQERPVSIVIREVDVDDEQKSQDDDVALFKGRVFRTGGRYYFRNEKFQPITNAKPGPEIDLYFEAPAGTDGPYKIRLTGDEIEKSEWELGWRITGSFEKPVQSNAFVRIRHSDYGGSENALRDLKRQCRDCVDLMYKRLDTAGGLWEAHAANYAKAYHAAFDTVTKALKLAAEQAAKESFLKELVFQVLAMASGGALSFISDFAKGALSVQLKKQKKKKVKVVTQDAPESFFSIPKDLADFYSGKALDQFKESWDEGDPKLELDALDPLRFHLDLSSRVKQVIGYYKTLMLNTLDHLDNRTKPEDYSNDDLAALKRAMNEFLGKSAKEMGLKYHVMSPPHNTTPYLDDPNQPDKLSFQALLETGLWSVWLPNLKVKGDENSPLTRGTFDYPSPPAEVVARLRKLGVLKRIGIDVPNLDHDAVNFSLGASKKLVDWAANWGKKEAAAHKDVFSQTEPPPGTSAAPEGVWKPGGRK